MSKSQNHLFSLPGRDLDHILSQAAADLEALRGRKLFVTGGTGFFGKWLLAGLQHANAELGLGLRVTVLSRDPAAFLRRHPEVADITSLNFIAGHLDNSDLSLPAQPLDQRLDVDRFFYSVRPYYKPYRVGRQEYRGANAGDFSGINEIDLLLGLCRANDPYYSQLLVDKMLFMIPADQERLRELHDAHKLLDELLCLLPEHAHASWSHKTRRPTSKCAACSGVRRPSITTGW